jgi:hypothetical protein
MPFSSYLFNPISAQEYAQNQHGQPAAQPHDIHRYRRVAIGGWIVLKTGKDKVIQRAANLTVGRLHQRQPQSLWIELNSVKVTRYTPVRRVNRINTAGCAYSFRDSPIYNESNGIGDSYEYPRLSLPGNATPRPFRFGQLFQHVLFFSLARFGVSSESMLRVTTSKSVPTLSGIAW